ncbi:hypothetical protein CEH00_20765 [Shigella boydii]|uniref:Uncharacterized protein n=1 Tax=Shigella boydii TaxID=621 RepID=A0A9Q5XX06_SHIBO|nr:hypothetical protein CEH00_20765 [Shigella boydii]
MNTAAYARGFAVTPEQGKSKHVIITVATDTGYHTLFMDKLSTWLSEPPRKSWRLNSLRKR